MLAALVVSGGAAAGAWTAIQEGGVAGSEAALGRVAFAPPPAEGRVALGPAHERKPLLSIARPLARGLEITAPSGILVDAGSGVVLWARRPHLRRPIASTTKIMTAIVALQRLRPNEVVVVPRAATAVEPFKEGLRAGERVPAWKLFYGMMLTSANDSAVAVAVAAGGSLPRFLELMNRKARELGLRNTRFRSPNGLLDEGNYSTAWDLAALTRYAMWNRRFRALVRTKRRRVSWPAPVHAKIYVNHNKLLRRYPGADGVKTGWTTKAGHCFVASAKRHGIRLIAVVLGSKDHYGDAAKLLDYGFAARG